MGCFSLPLRKLSAASVSDFRNAARIWLWYSSFCSCSSFRSCSTSLDTFCVGSTDSSTPRILRPRAPGSTPIFSKNATGSLSLSASVSLNEFRSCSNASRCLRILFSSRTRASSLSSLGSSTSVGGLSLGGSWGRASGSDGASWGDSSFRASSAWSRGDSSTGCWVWSDDCSCIWSDIIDPFES